MYSISQPHGYIQESEKELHDREDVDDLLTMPEGVLHLLVFRIIVNLRPHNH
jgi:hypothetical protein